MDPPLPMQPGLEHDTIAAIATAEGPAGVAVVRISGDQAWQVAERVLGPGKSLADRAAGQFFLASFVDASGACVDEGLVLLFRAPASFTGEDVVELQGHGGKAASQAVLRVVLAAGARLAQPGEFTRRAFLNGRMDLTQAEAIMDLVHARSERAAQAAAAQLAGGLGQEVEGCYQEITVLGADVAAQLDFEAQELPARVGEETTARLERVRAHLARLLATRREGHLLREGALVVIGGCPNAGKSSLLNALLGTDRAIVSPEAGTTRDTIEEGVVLDGIPLRLVDTAGLRAAPSSVEQAGVRRARQALDQADLIVYLIDASRPLAEQHFGVRETVQTILVMNKMDLPSQTQPDEILQMHRAASGRVAGGRVASVQRLSLTTGAGLVELKAALVQALGVERQASVHPTVTERHGVELAQAEQALIRARTLLAGDEAELVLAAGELRQAAEALGRIIGRNPTNDLLDQIFARFCVGK